MKKSIAAEEKLLRLIRKKDHTVMEKEVSAKREKNESAQATNFLKNINKLLLICIIILSGYLIREYFFTEDVPEEDFSVSTKLPDSSLKTGSSVVLNKKKDFSYYLDEYEGAQLFTFPWDKEVAAENTLDDNVNFSSVLKIVGIVLDANPQAIIEDLELKQTFFVSVGEEVHGATVKAIQADKVILLHNGNESELFP